MNKDLEWFSLKNPKSFLEKTGCYIEVPYARFSRYNSHIHESSCIRIKCPNGQEFRCCAGAYSIWGNDISFLNFEDFQKIMVYSFVFRAVKNNEASENRMVFSLFVSKKIFHGLEYYDCRLLLEFNDEVKTEEYFKIYRNDVKTGEPNNYFDENELDYKDIIHIGSLIKNKKLRKVYDKFFPGGENLYNQPIPDICCDKEYKRLVRNERYNKIFDRFKAIREWWIYQKNRYIADPLKNFYYDRIEPRLKKYRNKKEMKRWIND